ncbi:expressed unknown protein [Seminavis robusta]|uniref:Uncharacterized protein n=1 Tax=Seminavis robusta TaxID=568900 RepID=A0A9N8HIL5_9STRA|nr:expressed unknown protein [Seminavis robusta]|eukprot:Sro603_g173870.1 n/a (237) ;mRNA; r:9294-10004
MGILDKAKNAAKHTKLKSEILLLDREINAKKQKFGIEVCGLLWDLDAKNGVGGKLSPLASPWEAAKADLTKIRDQKAEIQAKIDADAESKQRGEKEDASVMDKAKATGTEGKRRAKLQLLEREAKARKQKFGVDAYDAAIQCDTGAASGGGSTLTDSKNQGAQKVSDSISSNKKMTFVEKQMAKAAVGVVSAGLSQLTVSETDVLKCIQTVQSEIEAITQKKDDKLAKIEQLKQPA